MTRKTKRFLLTLASVTVGFFVVLFIGAAASSGGPVAIEQTEPVIPEWKPRVREFTLDDGTRCIAVSTRATNFPKDSGFSGIACNWNSNGEVK